MTTIKQKQQLVLDYIDRYPQTPLVFKQIFSAPYGTPAPTPVVQDIPNTESKTLKELVYAILENCIRLGSFEVESNKYETSYGRMRSSLDIWRHVKYYRPDVDIFSVMEALYQLRNELYGHYCSTVRRGVFKIRSQWINWSQTSHPTTFFTREYQSSEGRSLTFAGWKKLHYKGEKKYE